MIVSCTHLNGFITYTPVRSYDIVSYDSSYNAHYNTAIRYDS